MSMIQSDLLLGQEGGAGYTISRSLRFNSSDSAYLSRTMSSASSTYTLSMWVKRSTLASNYKYLFSSGNAGIAFYNGTDQFYIFDGGTVHATTGVYRDTSAWYHILLSVSSNTGAAYINSTQVLSGKNTASLSTTANATNIGRYYNSGSGDFYFDGYIADVYLIDGQALTPSSFGEFSATTGRWEPKKYSGPTPTGNSFWLPFSDNSAATATTLGKDGFLLGNNWTCNNITVDAAGFSTTIASSQVWSNYLSPSGSGWQDATRDATKAFDSDLTTFAYVNSASSSEYINFSFPSGISNHGGFIWLRGGNGNGQGLDNMTVTINGSTVSSTARTGTAWNNWFKFPVSGALTSFRITGVYPVLNAVSFWTDYSTIVVNSQAITYGAPAVKDGDSTVDTPSSAGIDTGLGGQVTGNYATLNPLDKGANLSLANGNLDVSNTATAWHSVRATIGLPKSGKYYWEYTINGSSQYHHIGVVNESGSLTSYIGQPANGYSWQSLDAQKWNNATPASYGTAATANDVVRVAFDADNGSIFVGLNGSWFGSSNPATNTSPMYSGLSASVQFFPAVSQYGTASGTFNFGQRPFAYTAPSGFKALCDTNLPAPVVAKSDQFFQTVLWTGDNSNSRTISGLNFSPDLVWKKRRTANGDSHYFVDSVRGDNSGVMRTLFSNQTVAEQTTSSDQELQYGYISALTSSGFTVSAGSNASIPRAAVNDSSYAYVAWAFDAGTTTTTNTAGSITSQVRANASAGFSIVTYTGNGVAGSTIGHGLNVAPSLIIAKTRNQVVNWMVYHRSLGSAFFMRLNTTEAATNDSVVWNSNPTSSVFYVGNASGSNWNASTTYVAYCFAPVNSYSAFGAYQGNGSADGPFVFTGMRPRWVLIKQTDVGRDWRIYDTSRNPYNLVDLELYPNAPNAEAVANGVDSLSNGFKLRSSGVGVNSSGGTYIYAAFAENPFQYARAR